MSIVVGVDGSAGGRRALEFAVSEGLLRGCGVRAVRVIAEGKDPEVAEDALRSEVDAAVGDRAAPPPVECQVHFGDAAEVLIRLSGEASLLVVGSHATDSMIHSALGSVSNACAQLARCPVVVLPRF